MADFESILSGALEAMGVRVVSEDALMRMVASKNHCCYLTGEIIKGPVEDLEAEMREKARLLCSVVAETTKHLTSIQGCVAAVSNTLYDPKEHFYRVRYMIAWDPNYFDFDLRVAQMALEATKKLKESSKCNECGRHAHEY